MTAATRPLRIVHVANFGEDQNGRAFYNVDRKLSLGLIRLGHFVYDFSYRHMARYDAPFRSKKLGVGKMQTRLLDVIEQVGPELLLLGHSELIEAATLEEIRRRFPQLKLAMWYVDWLEEAHKRENVRQRLSLVDAVFCTTGGEALRAVAGSAGNLHFMPNPADPAIERHRNDLQQQFDWEMIYCGRDYKDPRRQAQLQELAQRLGSEQLCLRGCLGYPAVFGAQYLSLLSRARCGLNYSRRNDIPLYSSDRLIQLAGNGLLTFTPRVPGLHQLFSEEQLVYFDDFDDLTEKFHYYQAHDEARIAIAKAGRERAHGDYSSSHVGRYLIDVTFKNEGYQRYEWLSF